MFDEQELLDKLSEVLEECSKFSPDFIESTMDICETFIVEQTRLLETIRTYTEETEYEPEDTIFEGTDTEEAYEKE